MKLPPDARLRADVGSLLEAAGEPAGAEVLEPILTHLRLLARWNDAYGLTRITEWPEVLDRHLRESLLPLRWIDDAPGRLLDVGSGNGFPGIPILACRPGLTGVLLERSERKGLFLDAVVRESGWGARVAVDPTDAESYMPGDAGRDQARSSGRERMSAADDRPRAVPNGPQNRVKSKSAADMRARDPEKTRASAPPEALEGSFIQQQGAGGGSPLFDVAVSRATLAPQRFLELIPRWVRPGGRVFLFAGELETPSVSGRGRHANGSVRHQQDESSTGLRVRRTTSDTIPGRQASYLHVFEVAPEPTLPQD